MTAEAHSATAQRDPPRSPTPVAGHIPPTQHRRSGHTDRGPCGPTRTGAELVVTDLVTCAREGDKQAWDALVERYSPLIWSICRRHRLRDADAEDVGQSVWLHLVDQLDKIRDPAALPGWLATTTRRECLRVLRAARQPLAAGYRLDAQILPAEQTGTAEQELLVAERHASLREAFLALSPSDQRLIGLLLEDPPMPYAQISSRLGIPVGSIGPHRGRCLDKLRRHPATAALINTEAHSTRSDINGQPMVQ
jgi:RNA polymerase sigma factor (sigma-70 family)